MRECLGEAAMYLEEVAPASEAQATFQFPLPTDYLGIDRTLTISFPKFFPDTSPTLTIEPNTWLQWPHSVPGHLCLYATGQRPPLGDAVTIVRETIERFRELIDLVVPTADPVERQRHFDNEVKTYWSHQLPSAMHQVILLDRPSQSSALLVMNRPVTSLDEEEPYYWIASTEKIINNHQGKLYKKSVKARDLANAAFYLRLETCPGAAIPAPKDVIAWLSQHTSEVDGKSLKSWWRESSDLTVRWILVELPNSIPPAVQVFVLRDKGLKEHSIKTYGSRAGRRRTVTHHNTGDYSLQSADCHLLIEEVVYSRFMSEETRALRDKKVALIGVGSLGSPLASNLLRTGIGTLLLIDPDRFQDANMGRHVLGVDALGQSKSTALARKLQRDFPLASVRAISDYFGSLNEEMIKALAHVDLVINTTANWIAEKFMWRIKPRYAKWGCIQAWTEPHGLVAHALYAAADEASTPHYLFDGAGHFQYKFSEWGDDAIHRLPACGDSFIVGGPIALSSSANMIANMAVEVLVTTESSSRWETQVASVDAIHSAGGKYVGPSLPEGIKQLTLSRKWPIQ